MADNVRSNTGVAATLNRYDKAKARKQESDHIRQEAGFYAWPNAWRQVKNSEQSEGEQNTLQLYDSTALMALCTDLLFMFIPNS